MSNERPEFPYATVTSVENFEFRDKYKGGLLIPDPLLEDKRFKNLAAYDRIVYAYMMKRTIMSSIENGWVDEHGHCYIIISDEDMVMALAIYKSRCINSLKRLSKYGLIEVTPSDTENTHQVYVMRCDW